MPATIIRETDKYIEYAFSDKYTRREQKFPCVGGPLNGKSITNRMLTENQLHYQPLRTIRREAAAGYSRYNRSGGGGRSDKSPRCVYVWIEL